MTAIEDLPPGADDVAAAEADVALNMDAQQVVEALQDVDDVFRAPLTLFYLEDLPYQEIADMLEVPIGTVMSRLSRGKAQLRAALARQAAEGASKVIPFPNSQRKTS